jgi:hypothetical protein
MKDADPPQPFELEGCVVELDELDDSGAPYSSLILKGTGNTPANQRPALNGKNQRLLLAQLEREPRIWSETELRNIARSTCGMGKSSAFACVVGLRQLGYLTACVGGVRLTDKPL